VAPSWHWRHRSRPPRACWTRYSAQSRPIERPAAYVIALAEHTRLDRLGDPAAYLISEAPFMAQLDALNDLIGTAPTTFVGLQAWASHLNEIRHVDEAWMFEEEAPTLVVTLVAALGNLAVTS
jgi:hypothetical protein